MNEERDYLKFDCKLTPKNGDVLFVSDGRTMLFQIYKDDESLSVGLNKEDVKELIQYLVKYL
jgi:hypothetical protein